MGARVLGDLRGPLLRPARAQGSARPAARGGGAAARRVAAALAVAVLLGLQATAANADTVDRQSYRDRLAAVRSQLASARSQPVAARGPLVDGARSELRRTTAIALDDGGPPLAVDDGVIADRLTTSDASIDAAIADVDLLIAAAGRAPATDPAAAEARLRQLAGEQRARDAQVSIPDAILRWLAHALSGVRGGPPDLRVVVVLAGGLGLAALLLLLAILGRDIRERFRRDVVVPEIRAARAPDAGAHLRAADDAIGAGHVRDAIHRLYLYAIAALASRELIRYDPSLTDREVLARAAAIPHADALRDLVDLHDRVWYGLHEAAPSDADRARGLALRAAA